MGKVMRDQVLRPPPRLPRKYRLPSEEPLTRADKVRLSLWCAFGFIAWVGILVWVCR